MKLEIHKRAQIHPSDQIIISSSGTQLKESDTTFEDTIVVFNRRLLQDPQCIEKLIQTVPHISESLIETNAIPDLKELEAMIQLYRLERKDKDVLYDTLDHVIRASIIIKCPVTE